LGQFFKNVPNLKQHVVAKLAHGKITITTTRPNLVIIVVVINLHMVMIQVHAGKNIVEDVLLNGGFDVNIMTKELRKQLGFPSPKPTLYTLRMANQTITKLVGLIKNPHHGISYIVKFTVMKSNVLDSNYSMLLD
jgi:hypothetical protein